MKIPVLHLVGPFFRYFWSVVEEYDSFLPEETTTNSEDMEKQWMRLKTNNSN